MFERHLELTCLSSIAPQVWGKFYVSMGVRYISADKHTSYNEYRTSALRVSRVSSIASRACPASFWRVRLCVEFSAQFWTCLKVCAELDARKRMVTNQKRWCSALDEWVGLTNDDEQRTTTHKPFFSVRTSCVLHAFTWCDRALNNRTGSLAKSSRFLFSWVMSKLFTELHLNSLIHVMSYLTEKHLIGRT